MSTTTTPPPLPGPIPTSNYQPNHPERYWQILQHNIEWLRFSETKATLLLTIYGVLFTIAYTNSTAVFDSIKTSNWILFLVFLHGAVSITSIVFGFLCVNPVLENKNPDSIIYFGHISKKFTDYPTYKAHAHAVIDNEDTLTNHITEQIYIISKIAWKKYVYVGWSLRFFILSLGLLILAVFSYLIDKL